MALVLVLAIVFGFGFDFCSVELRKYVDSVLGWVGSGSVGWVRVQLKLKISQS